MIIDLVTADGFIGMLIDLDLAKTVGVGKAEPVTRWARWSLW